MQFLAETIGIWIVIDQILAGTRISPTLISRGKKPLPMCNISQQIYQHIMIIVRVPKRTYHDLSNKNLSEDDFLRIFPDQNL